MRNLYCHWISIESFTWNNSSCNFNAKLATKKPWKHSTADSLLLGIISSAHRPHPKWDANSSRPYESMTDRCNITLGSSKKRRQPAWYLNGYDIRLEIVHSWFATRFGRGGCALLMVPHKYETAVHCFHDFLIPRLALLPHGELFHESTISSY